MAIQSIAVINAYRPVRRNGNASWQAHKPTITQNASKLSFEASMERSQLNQRYWDELLKKLRKSGGGSGGSNQFDRIAVSMMLTNFLSNKAIQALLRNFIGESLNQNLNVVNLHQSSVQNRIISFIQIMYDFTSPLINNISSLANAMKSLSSKAYLKLSSELSGILTILSFQLHKLKEVLEQDFKEAIRKLDVKEKLKKIRTALNDYFIELGNDLISSVNTLKSYVDSFIPNFVKETFTSLDKIFFPLNKNRESAHNTIKSH